MVMQKRGVASRADIISAARAEIMDVGFEKMSITSIGARTGGSRSLFYHYFKNKDEVATAVLDDVIDEFLAKLTEWNDAREPGDISRALDEAIELMRSIINDDGPFHHQLVSGPNASLYMAFTDRTARKVADYISRTTVRDFADKHPVEIEYVPETFYMLVVGLVSLIRSNPSISNRAIKQIAGQTLHLDKYL
ncbi:AcrR family transcriptional regulator [Arcanobacterium pluranimalium]|uniref:TetR/AcrR family transcriptional regulator n=1 Tax=Arcanobacterium pluranimalium TaxID=108028 RepID=UPI00195DAA6A|nr:TetR/AcrR family transcriptional regulator [Arcanobacterium pluranimalium]MBM7824961.1 AcrR family transcriptional regulator [Arcanobacterium pluranimalium]